MLIFHSDTDANILLDLVNQESCSAVAGIELAVLSYRWRSLGYDEEALGAAIERLVSEGWLRPVDATLRLTSQGYAQLISDAVEPLREAPALREAPVVVAPNEYTLRNRVLDVFRYQGIEAGGKLAAAELSRYWEASHYRANELRAGLDILLRDGHIKIGRFSRAVFRLEKDGYAYMTGRPAPPDLVRHAVPVELANMKRRGISDQTLCILGSFQMVHGSSSQPVDFGVLDYLLERFELPAYARFHAIDLMHRLGHAELSRDGTALWLGDSGQELARSMNKLSVQWRVKTDLKEALDNDLG